MLLRDEDGTVLFHSVIYNSVTVSSVAEPPLFWGAPARDGQGPGADSGSDLLGSAPAKKGGSGSIH